MTLISSTHTKSQVRHMLVPSAPGRHEDPRGLLASVLSLLCKF